MQRPRDDTNLWLAQVLWDLGGVQFGDFTLGRSTRHSPVYVNPRRLISRPQVLHHVAKLIMNEVQTSQALRRPRIHPFDLVAGVPVGGLHLATAFSLASDNPMIYVRESGQTGNGHAIEGVYQPGDSVLMIDDLITTGGSIIQSGALLQEAGLKVHDVIVLIDREQGAAERLRHNGYNLVSILKLKTMLTYYFDQNLISEDWYYRSMAYIEANQAAPTD